MPSYQDIEVRLEVVEDKIDMIMKSLTFTKQTQLPTLGPDGRPVVRVEQKTLLDIYREIKTAGAVPINASEVVNG